MGKGIQFGLLLLLAVHRVPFAHAAEEMSPQAGITHSVLFSRPVVAFTASSDRKLKPLLLDSDVLEMQNDKLSLRTWSDGPSTTEAGARSLRRSALGSDTLMSRPNTLEDVVRRFHREGLPLAKLWHTDSSTVNFGLTPRGKPGLWFVKKLP